MRQPPWEEAACRVGLDGLAVQDLTEQDATNEGVALLALEPRLVRPGVIGERGVVEEMPRLLGVRQGLPRRCLLRLLRLPRRCLCLCLCVCRGYVPDLGIVASDRVLTGLADPREIARVGATDFYRVVDAIAEAVREDGVVHGRLAAISLRQRE